MVPEEVPHAKKRETEIDHYQDGKHLPRGHPVKTGQRQGLRVRGQDEAKTGASGVHHAELEAGERGVCVAARNRPLFRPPGRAQAGRGVGQGGPQQSVLRAVLDSHQGGSGPGLVP